MPYSKRNAATAARPPARSVTPRIMAREAHAGHRPAGRTEVGGVSRLTLAGKIDAILKLSVVASVLLASSSVGYYYLVHLPHQDAQFEPERVLERLRAAAKKACRAGAVAFRTTGIGTTNGGTTTCRRAANLGEGQSLSSVSKPRYR